MKIKKVKAVESKPKYRHIIDPVQVAALIKIGKWRPEKPFWTREYSEGGATKALWLEVTSGSPGEAWLKEAPCTNLSQS